jgi:hypothetical protein
LVIVPFPGRAIAIERMDGGIEIDGLSDHTKIETVLQGVANSSCGELLDIELYNPVNLTASRMRMSLTNIEWVQGSILTKDSTFQIIRESSTGFLTINQQIPELKVGKYRCILSTVPKQDGLVTFQISSTGWKRSGPSSVVYQLPRVNGTLATCTISIAINGKLAYSFHQQ